MAPRLLPLQQEPGGCADPGEGTGAAWQEESPRRGLGAAGWFSTGQGAVGLHQAGPHCWVSHPKLPPFVKGRCREKPPAPAVLFVCVLAILISLVNPAPFPGAAPCSSLLMLPAGTYWGNGGCSKAPVLPPARKGGFASPRVQHQEVPRAAWVKAGNRVSLVKKSRARGTPQGDERKTEGDGVHPAPWPAQMPQETL